jgi:hypothetical protein
MLGRHELCPQRLEVPTALIPPHIIFLILFLASISIDLKYMINKVLGKFQTLQVNSQITSH